MSQAGTEEAFEPATARNAYTRLSARLADVEDTESSRIRSPLLSVLSAIKVMADFVSRPKEREKFAALPGFDLRNIDDLREIAAAYWYTTVQLRATKARETRALVEPELAERATLRKTRMFALLEYHLSDLPLVKRELDEIRSGQGYEDLASDLVRLAELQETHQEVVQYDTRNYQEEDPEAARAEALEILSQRTDADRSPEEWEVARRRAATLLVNAHKEIMAAANWLYRDNPAVADRFMSLNSSRRSPKAPATTIAPPANTELDTSNVA